MMEIIIKERSMVMEHSHGLMVESTMIHYLDIVETGRMVSNMVKDVL